MKTYCSALGLVALLALASGCTKSLARIEAAREQEQVPAAIYKAGRGIQLSPVAASALEMKCGDVIARDVAEARGVGAIPANALLRTIKGDFVYVANGGWFLRTPVTIGASDGEWYEVREGLYEGDSVVTHGTRAIWLAELQAVNGGVGCADDN